MMAAFDFRKPAGEIDGIGKDGSSAHYYDPEKCCNDLKHKRIPRRSHMFDDSSSSVDTLDCVGGLSVFF